MATLSPNGQVKDWTLTNIFYLSLMTLGYIFGEIAHFLINTTSKEVARGKCNSFLLNKTEKVQSMTVRQVYDRKNLLGSNKHV